MWSERHLMARAWGQARASLVTKDCMGLARLRLPIGTDAGCCALVDIQRAPGGNNACNPNGQQTSREFTLRPLSDS